MLRLRQTYMFTSFDLEWMSPFKFAYISISFQTTNVLYCDFLSLDMIPKLIFIIQVLQFLN